MAAASVETEPIRESISKVNDDISVGADLDFQRRWWRFERVIWWLFGLIVALDVLGCFGRGPLAHAKYQTHDGSMQIKYERVERLSTPSRLSIEFGAQAIKDGKIEVLVSDSLVKRLGNQRVVPQPAESKLSEGKILYTFPASVYPAGIQFGLEPADVGLSSLSLQVQGNEEVRLNIFVVP